jgi:hypothetical protein
MRRLAIASVAIAVVLFASGLSAQGKDFSGKWTVDAEKSAAAMGGGGGGGGRAGAGGGGGGRGGGGPMTITQDAKTLTIERTVGENTTKTVYNLDGSESKNMAGRAGQQTEQVSTAKWDANKLVITTKTANGERVVTWYLEGGELVQESTGPNGPVKLYYKKG